MEDFNGWMELKPEKEAPLDVPQGSGCKNYQTFILSFTHFLHFPKCSQQNSFHANLPTDRVTETDLSHHISAGIHIP